MEADKKVKLKALEADIKKWGATLKEAAETITNENISNYPIFTAHQFDVNIGIELLKQERAKTNWSFNATTLEELVSKNIVAKEGLDSFRQLYKEKARNEFVCIFTIFNEQEAEFVFYPYKDTNVGGTSSDS